MKKITAAAMPDPQRLRAALAKAEKARTELAEFRTITIPKWRAEYANLVKTGDPHDDEHLRHAAHARERVEIAVNYLRKFERELAPAHNAALRAVQEFDRAFLAAADAEYNPLLDEITAVVRPYCRDVEEVTQAPGYQAVDTGGVSLASQGITRITPNAARGVASRCTILSYIPRGFDALAAQFDPAYAHSLTHDDDHLAWQEMPSFEEAAVAAGFGPDGRAVVLPALDKIGGFKLQDIDLAGCSVHRAPMPGEVFQLAPAQAEHAARSNAAFLRIVEGRAAALLKRHAEWVANGSRFVPQNFADLGPLLLPDAAPPVSVSVAANLGGTAKDMRAQGGHGVPAVDLQSMKL